MSVDVMDEQAVELVRIDDWLVDPRTGECVEYVGRPEFHVVDQDSFDWVMEKMQDAKLDVDKQKQKLKEVTANIEAEIRRAESRLKGLHFRFDNELQDYGRKVIADPKYKGKTVHSPYGKVAFTATKPRWTWAADKAKAMKDAVAYLRQRLPIEKCLDAINVKVEETTTLEQIQEHCPDPSTDTAMLKFLTFVPAGEKVTIEPGGGR